MKRIILLNNGKWPSAFAEVNVTPPAGQNKTEYIEEKIIEAVNGYFPYMNVQEIEYGNYEKQFHNYLNYVYNGMIVEEFPIDEALRQRYTSDNTCVFEKQPGEWYCRRIVLYLFISGPLIGARNSFVSQIVLPTLTDYAEMFSNSPCYDIANHDFCFVNILTSNLPPSILSQLIPLCKIGMHYVEVLDSKSLDTNNLPGTLKEFFEKYYNHNPNSDIYNSSDFCIDFKKETMRIKPEGLDSGLIKNGNVYEFHGSNDKFTLITLFPIAIMAHNMGYEVDYSEIETFVTDNYDKFKGDKIRRFKVMFDYLKKYFAR